VDADLAVAVPVDSDRARGDLKVDHMEKQNGRHRSSLYIIKTGCLIARKLRRSGTRTSASARANQCE
jgi:hypothetical protein